MTTSENLTITNDHQPTYATGNVLPLLHEIKHAIERLSLHHEETVIDLRRLPLTSDEEDALKNFLGDGEVHATLNAIGPSSLQETQYAGVWIVTHFNEQNEIMGKFINVTIIPDILFAQMVDVKAGLTQMKARLNNNAEG